MNIYQRQPEMLVISVKLHGVAFFISMLNLLRAASLYNERLSFTVLVSPQTFKLNWLPIEIVVIQFYGCDEHAFHAELETFITFLKLK
jgi:hypothetical protein